MYFFQVYKIKMLQHTCKTKIEKQSKFCAVRKFSWIQKLFSKNLKKQVTFSRFFLLQKNKNKSWKRFVNIFYRYIDFVTLFQLFSQTFFNAN